MAIEPYAISFDLRGRRRSIVLRLPAGIAKFVGRHVHRLGRRRWQIEQGLFPSSWIPTAGQPVTGRADGVSLTGDREWTAVMSTLRFTERGGILIEGERTNLALWTE